jgi:predicted enzyme related to lactoylglutathione lyase
MAKVIGIGGVFLKFRDPDAMRKWYQEVLGMTPNAYGVLFKFNLPDAEPGYCQLGTFPANSPYFGSETQQCMLNFRVDNLVELEQALRAAGTTIVNEIAVYEFGKFLHIEDPEGNRIELWEPIDTGFDKEDSMPMR